MALGEANGFDGGGGAALAETEGPGDGAVEPAVGFGVVGFVPALGNRFGDDATAPFTTALVT